MKPNSKLNKSTTTITIALLVLSLIPLLAISIYDHPCADDYTYGNLTHRIWEDTHSMWQVLKGAGKTVAGFYNTWQGTYGSIFLMALQPSVFADRLYMFTSWIMLGSLLIGHFVFLKVLLMDYFKINRYACLTVTGIVLLLSIQLVLSPVEAFYWFNGAVHYTFMHGCMLLFCGILLKILQEVRRKRKYGYLAAACILAVLLGGSNYITSLLSVVLMVLLLAIGTILKQKNMRWLTAPAILLFAGFLINVLSPGNLTRMQGYTDTPGPVSAIIQSLFTAIEYIIPWTNAYVLLALLFLIPVIWKSLEGSEKHFCYPAMVSAVSFCLVACMFTPSIFTMGNPGHARTTNIIMMMYYLLLVLNLIYWMGWLRVERRWSIKKAAAWTKALPVYYGVVILLTAWMLSGEYHNNLTSLSAAYSLAERHAKAYHEETLHRVSLLSMEGVSEVWIPNYNVKPHVLFFDDITEDPNDWRNAAVAEWYGKEKVYLSNIY